MEATVVSGPLTTSIGLIAFGSLGRATSFQTELAILLTSQSLLQKATKVLPALGRKVS